MTRRLGSLALLIFVLLSGCGRPARKCVVPSPPILPEIGVAQCLPGVVCMETNTAVAWAKWSEQVILWQDLVNSCEAVQDTGKPMLRLSLEGQL